MRPLPVLCSSLLLLALGCDPAGTDVENLDDSAEEIDLDSEDGPDSDGDGFGEQVDCDDGDPKVHPGATERCNGVDDDCDDQTPDAGMVTVDGDATFATVSQAIAASVAGSALLVCDGTYHETLLATRDLTIRSLNGAAVTTIDGGGADTVLRMVGGALTVEGLTLTGGDAEGATSSGGGINAWQASALVVTGCVITANAADLGGGISLGAITATLTDTVVSSNVADRGGAVWAGGGTVYCAGSTAMTGNTATTGGGGLWVQEAGTTDGCAMQGNSSSDRGGGLVLVDGSAAEDVVAGGNSAPNGGGVYLRDATLIGAILQDNQADYGGGIYVSGGGVGSSTVTGGTVTGNTSTESGGGLYALGAASIDGTTFTQNGSDNRGGGIYASGAAVAVTATLDGNTAALRGGGLYANNAATVTLTAATLTANLSERGGGIYVNGAASVAVNGGVVQRNGDVDTLSGGGARITDGQLSANASDWGEDTEDNVPDDVYIEVGQTSFGSFGVGASFTCDASVCSQSR